LQTPGCAFSGNHVTEKAQDEGFVSGLSAIPCVLQSVVGPPTRLRDLLVQQVTFGQVGHEPGAASRDAHESCAPHRAIEERESFGALLRPDEGQSEARAGGRKKDADVMGLNERQRPSEVSNGVREVPADQIRAAQAKAGRGHLKRILALLGPREAAFAKCQGFAKLANFGEAPCEKGTDQSMSGIPAGWTITGDPVLESVHQPAKGTCRRPVLAQSHQRQARIVRSLALELSIPRPTREQHGPLTGSARALVVSDAIEVVGAADRHRGFTAFVPEPRRHAGRLFEHYVEPSDASHT
jgi:hypothetical protein